MRCLRTGVVLYLFAGSFGWHQASAGSHGGSLNVEQVFSDARVLALIAAVESNDSARAQAQLRSGARVNCQGNYEITPLVWVMGGGDRTAVKRLLRLGADPNQKVHGNNPTWIAAGRDDSGMLELMLQYRGDPNTVGDDGSSALEVATKEHFEKNIDLLVRHGADINHVDAHDETAATWAGITGSIELVAHLLELGYSHDLPGLARLVDGVQVNDEQEHWKPRVVQLLKDRGVKYPLQRGVPSEPSKQSTSGHGG